MSSEQTSSFSLDDSRKRKLDSDDDDNAKAKIAKPSLGLSLLQSYDEDQDDYMTSDEDSPTPSKSGDGPAVPTRNVFIEEMTDDDQADENPTENVSPSSKVADNTKVSSSEPNGPASDEPELTVTAEVEENATFIADSEKSVEDSRDDVPDPAAELSKNAASGNPVESAKTSSSDSEVAIDSVDPKTSISDTKVAVETESVSKTDSIIDLKENKIGRTEETLSTAIPDSQDSGLTATVENESKSDIRPDYNFSVFGTSTVETAFSNDSAPSKPAKKVKLNRSKFIRSTKPNETEPPPVVPSVSVPSPKPVAQEVSAPVKPEVKVSENEVPVVRTKAEEISVKPAVVIDEKVSDESDITDPGKTVPPIPEENVSKEIDAANTEDVSVSVTPIPDPNELVSKTVESVSESAKSISESVESISESAGTISGSEFISESVVTSVLVEQKDSLMIDADTEKTNDTPKSPDSSATETDCQLGSEPALVEELMEPTDKSAIDVDIVQSSNSGAENILNLQDKVDEIMDQDLDIDAARDLYTDVEVVENLNDEIIEVQYEEADVSTEEFINEDPPVDAIEEYTEELFDENSTVPEAINENLIDEELITESVGLEDLKDETEFVEEMKDEHLCIEETKDDHVLAEEPRDDHLAGRLKDENLLVEDSRDEDILVEESRDENPLVAESKDEHLLVDESKDENLLVGESNDEHFVDESKDEHPVVAESKDDHLIDKSKEENLLGEELVDENILDEDSKAENLLTKESVEDPITDTPEESKNENQFVDTPEDSVNEEAGLPASVDNADPIISDDSYDEDEKEIGSENYTDDKDAIEPPHRPLKIIIRKKEEKLVVVEDISMRRKKDSSREKRSSGKKKSKLKSKVREGHKENIEVGEKADPEVNIVAAEPVYEKSADIPEDREPIGAKVTGSFEVDVENVLVEHLIEKSEDMKSNEEENISIPATSEITDKHSIPLHSPEVEHESVESDEEIFKDAMDTLEPESAEADYEKLANSSELPPGQEQPSLVSPVASDEETVANIDTVDEKTKSPVEAESIQTSTSDSISDEAIKMDVEESSIKSDASSSTEVPSKLEQALTRKLRGVRKVEAAAVVSTPSPDTPDNIKSQLEVLPKELPVVKENLKLHLSVQGNRVSIKKNVAAEAALAAEVALAAEATQASEVALESAPEPAPTPAADIEPPPTKVKRQYRKRAKPTIDPALLTEEKSYTLRTRNTRNPPEEVTPKKKRGRKSAAATASTDTTAETPVATSSPVTSTPAKKEKIVSPLVTSNPVKKEKEVPPPDDSGLKKEKVTREPRLPPPVTVEIDPPPDKKVTSAAGKVRPIRLKIKNSGSTIECSSRYSPVTIEKIGGPEKGAMSENIVGILEEARKKDTQVAISQEQPAWSGTDLQRVERMLKESNVTITPVSSASSTSSAKPVFPSPSSILKPILTAAKPKSARKSIHKTSSMPPPSSYSSISAASITPILGEQKDVPAESEFSRSLNVIIKPLDFEEQLSQWKIAKSGPEMDVTRISSPIAKQQQPPPVIDVKSEIRKKIASSERRRQQLACEPEVLISLDEESKPKNTYQPRTKANLPKPTIREGRRKSRSRPAEVVVEPTTEVIVEDTKSEVIVEDIKSEETPDRLQPTFEEEELIIPDSTPLAREVEDVTISEDEKIVPESQVENTAPKIEIQAVSEPAGEDLVILEPEDEPDILLEPKVEDEVALEPVAQAEDTLDPETLAQVQPVAEVSVTLEPETEAQEMSIPEAESMLEVKTEIEAEAEVAFEAETGAEVALEPKAEAEVVLEPEVEAAPVVEKPEIEVLEYQSQSEIEDISIKSISEDEKVEPVVESSVEPSEPELKDELVTNLTETEPEVQIIAEVRTKTKSNVTAQQQPKSTLPEIKSKVTILPEPEYDITVVEEPKPEVKQITLDSSKPKTGKQLPDLLPISKIDGKPHLTLKSVQTTPSATLITASMSQFMSAQPQQLTSPFAKVSPTSPQLAAAVSQSPLGAQQLPPGMSHFIPMRPQVKLSSASLTPKMLKDALAAAQHQPTTQQMPFGSPFGRSPGGTPMSGMSMTPSGTPVMVDSSVNTPSRSFLDAATPSYSTGPPTVFPKKRGRPTKAMVAAREAYRQSQEAMGFRRQSVESVPAVMDAGGAPQSVPVSEDSNFSIEIVKFPIKRAKKLKGEKPEQADGSDESTLAEKLPVDPEREMEELKRLEEDRIRKEQERERKNEVRRQKAKERSDAEKAKKLRQRMKAEERHKRVQEQRRQLQEQKKKLEEEIKKGFEAGRVSGGDVSQMSNGSFFMDEDSSSLTFDSMQRLKKTKMEVYDPDGNNLTVDQIAEYQWPIQGGELYMIQEQISNFLGVKSFKRKYPDIKRRPVDSEERAYLVDSGLVSESLCDLGITAVCSAEVLDIMCSDFSEKYEELRKFMREKQLKELSFKQKAWANGLGYKLLMADGSKQDLKKRAMESASNWNSALNKSRYEDRRSAIDLQTFIIHYPKSKTQNLGSSSPKIGSYPVSILPGQFSDFYKEYTSTELRYLPLNTVIYGPVKHPSAARDADGSQTDSDDSSSSDDSSTTSEGTQGTEDTLEDMDKDMSLDESSLAEKLPDGNTSVREDRDTNRRELTNGVAEAAPADGKILCKVCLGDENRNKENVPEVLIYCSQCCSSCHPTCLDLSLNMVPHIKSYKWQCTDCKNCARCKEFADEDKMLFCDTCDRGYHIYCVGLRKVPPGSWQCQECTAVVDPPGRENQTLARSLPSSIPIKIEG